jgi:phosphatidylglycerophosphate synthase
MLPYLIYALFKGLPDLAVGTLAVMIATDLVDGRIARAIGQARDFGGALDSTVDFAVIYGLFTAFFATGLLPWWKWAVIMIPGVLIAVTQLSHAAKAGDVVFAPSRAAKLVGQIQYLYLPFLVARTFWLTAGWAETADHVIFAALAAAIVFNTVGQTRLLIELFRAPQAKTPRIRPDTE